MHPTEPRDYFRLGEVLRDGLRLATGPRLRVRRRERAAPPAPLADHAGGAAEEVDLPGGDPFVAIRHDPSLPC